MQLFGSGGRLIMHHSAIEELHDATGVVTEISFDTQYGVNEGILHISQRAIRIFGARVRRLQCKTPGTPGSGRIKSNHARAVMSIHVGC